LKPKPPRKSTAAGAGLSAQIAYISQEQLFRDSTSLVLSNHSSSPQPKSPVTSADDYTKIGDFENLEIALFDVADPQDLEDDEKLPYFLPPLTEDYPAFSVQ
jgi:hypothetical protein